MKRLLLIALLSCSAVLLTHPQYAYSGASTSSDVQGPKEGEFPITPPNVAQCTFIGCYRGTRFIDVPKGTGMEGFNVPNEGGVAQTPRGTHYLPNSKSLSDDAQYTKDPANGESGALLTGEFCVYLCDGSLVYIWKVGMSWNSEG